MIGGGGDRGGKGGDKARGVKNTRWKKGGGAPHLVDHLC